MYGTAGSDPIQTDGSMQFTGVEAGYGNTDLAQSGTAFGQPAVYAYGVTGNDLSAVIAHGSAAAAAVHKQTVDCNNIHQLSIVKTTFDPWYDNRVSDHPRQRDKLVPLSGSLDAVDNEIAHQHLLHAEHPVH